jgi:hypothetical protein
MIGKRLQEKALRDVVFGDQDALDVYAARSGRNLCVLKFSLTDDTPVGQQMKPAFHVMSVFVIRGYHD